MRGPIIVAVLGGSTLQLLKKTREAISNKTHTVQYYGNTDSRNEIENQQGKNIYTTATSRSVDHELVENQTSTDRPHNESIEQNTTSSTQI